MPDISTIKVLIAEKSQFKVLQYEMLEIELNTTRIIKAIIYFGSRILLSLIGKIQLLISSNTVNFHIIDIPILFFLYLKNIVIFDIYLNNIINQLICQNDKNISIFYK